MCPSLRRNDALLRSTEKERPFYRNKDSLKEIVTVDVRSVREEADALAKSVREIDTMIQEANWSTNI